MEQEVEPKRQRLHVPIADGDSVYKCNGSRSRHRIALAAQTQEIVLNSGRPVRCECPFDAPSCQPAAIAVAV
jgi:hypothetical protein